MKDIPKKKEGTRCVYKNAEMKLMPKRKKIQRKPRKRAKKGKKKEHTSRSMTPAILADTAKQR